MMRLVASGLVAAWVGVAGAGIVVGQSSPAAATLAVAGRTNATVSIGADGNFVVVTWSASEPGGATDIYASVSRDAGRTFSSPTRVNSTAGDTQVNGEQPPRVALSARSSGAPRITIVWTSKGEAGNRISFARSDDGGRTFTPSAAVPAGEAPGRRGWHNVTVDSKGQVRVVWLDHREMLQTGSGEGHATGSTGASKPDGVAMAQLSKLYTATIDDPASARMLFGGVCFCCKTALDTGPDGAIYASWRHVYPGNLRDMAFAVSRNGGAAFTNPVRVSEDNWKIEGCPEDGPALAVDGRNQVHLVWPSLVNDGPDGRPSIGIFYARSTDGRTFTPRQRLATEGVPHHPQAVIAGSTLVVAWDELKDGVRHAVAARRPFAAAADAPFTRTVIGSEAPGIYPALASSGDRVWVAWSVNAPDRKVVRVAVLQ